jgi:hypothetical protein
MMTLSHDNSLRRIDDVVPTPFVAVEKTKWVAASPAVTTLRGTRPLGFTSDVEGHTEKVQTPFLRI